MQIDVGVISGVNVGIEFQPKELFDEEDFECKFGMIIDLFIIRFVITW